ncbi:MAG: stage sporulation protein [Actinomycetota bacterium]|jgi:peptidoglycan hydrolase-like amidase|nr:stage sporulation protein [Actinomycetota bacterium]
MAAAVLGPGAAPAARADTSFVFHGGGFGHALGMSQYGAMGMARSGFTYQQILTHYYTGITVSAPGVPATIRVGLRQGSESFRLTGTGNFNFSATKGGPAVAIGSANQWWAITRTGTLLYLTGPDNVKRGPYSQVWQSTNAGEHLKLVEWNGSQWVTTGDYAHGQMQVVANSGGSATYVVLQDLTLEQYVAGIGEVPSTWPTAAKQAQAVAARTYGARLITTGGRSNCGCDLFDDTRDQVYSGWATEQQSGWTSAVNSTPGVVATYQGTLITAYYSSSSGGWTEDNEKVWGGSAIAYLRGVEDPYDNQPENPNYRWTRTFSGTALSSTLNGWLAARGRAQIGTVQSVVYPAPRGHGGRIIIPTAGGGGATFNGTSGQARLSGEDLRGALGFPGSMIVDPSNVATTDVSGGWVVDALGGFHSFGGAASPSGGRYRSTWTVRDATARGDGRGGYVLDGNGTLDTLNGAPGLAKVPAFGSDIARSIALSGNGDQGQILDGYGGLHPIGTATSLGPGPYWNGWDIARAVALTADGKGAYVLDGYGGIHPVGTAPAVSGAPYFGFDIARDIALRRGGGGYVLDGYGGLHAFGGAPAATGGSYHGGSDTAAALVLRSRGAGGYVVERGGPLVAMGGAPVLTVPDSFTNNAARAVVLPPDPGAYVMAGSGQVAAAGLAPGVTGSPSFSSDIGRDLVMRPNATGYEVDGYGGIHEIGAGAHVHTGGQFFSGQDRIRAIALTPDGTQGYTLDKNGTLYNFDGAPAVTVTGSWWADSADIARALTLTGSAKGYLLDEGGALHEFGGAPALFSGPPSWYAPGQNKFVAFALAPDQTSGYVLESNGTLHPFGSAPAATAPGVTAPARDVILRPDGRSGWVVDAGGGLRPFGGAPPVSGGLGSGQVGRAGTNG